MISLIGPISIRVDILRRAILGERTAAQWQMDAFGQIDEWLRAAGIRS